MGGLAYLVERWVQHQLGVGGTPVWGHLTGEQALEEVREGRLHPVRIQGMDIRQWKVAGSSRTAELLLEKLGMKAEAMRVPTGLLGPRDVVNQRGGSKRPSTVKKGAVRRGEVRVNPPGGSKPPATARKVAWRQGKIGGTVPGLPTGGGAPVGGRGAGSRTRREGGRWTTVRAGPPMAAHPPRIDAPGGIRAVPPPRWEPSAGPPVPSRGASGGTGPGARPPSRP